jgi:hypothetical protein
MSMFYNHDVNLSDLKDIEKEIEIQSKLTILHNESLKKSLYSFTVKHKELYTPDNQNILKKLGYYILVKN